MQELVAVAKITKPRGIRGEAVADVLTDFPERFDSLKECIGLKPDGERIELVIERYFFQKERIVLKFEGFDTIEAAEELRGTEICVREDEAVELGEGEFFDWDLEGCDVLMPDGGSLGTVTQLMRTGGTELLVVKGTEREYLIPFAEAICTDIDVAGKTIRIDPPEGLLDF